MGAWRPDLSWIAPDLAVGGRFPVGRAADLARRHGVGAVIDVRVEAGDVVEERAACGLEFLHLPTEDLQGVSQPMLDEGVDFAGRMAADRRKLLIHCTHGSGRSATLALCVLADRAKVSPSLAQYDAWVAWLGRRRPGAAVPSYHEFGCVAYRHLTTPA